MFSDFSPLVANQCILTFLRRVASCHVQDF